MVTDASHDQKETSDVATDEPKRASETGTVDSHD